MTVRRAFFAFCLAARLYAQQVNTPPVVPAVPAARVEKINWQAPPDPAASKPTQPKPAKVTKSGGKKKWIILAAVAGGVIITAVVVNKRLSNEGAGIF